MDEYYRKTYIKIDLDQILYNINTLKETCSKNKYFYAIIKGDAYGHGLKQVAQIVIESKADGIGVATLDEAILLRQYFNDVKILCLGIIPLEYIEDAIANDITITIANIETVEKIKNTTFDKIAQVHIKVNTGMNRIGFNDQNTLNEIVTTLNSVNNLEIEGIFTHFSTAEDEENYDYIYYQIDNFKKVLKELNYDFKHIHCTNSASLIKLHQELDFTTANRAGIAIYGALEDNVQDSLNLKTAFKLVSSINNLQYYPKNTKISYNVRYTSKKDSEIIATIPLGYADGFSRLHSQTLVKCNDQYGTIVGTICMDQLMIRFDKPVKINDTVELISQDSSISVYQRAKQAKTITHEIYTRFTNRIPKIYYRNNEVVEINNPVLKK